MEKSPNIVAPSIHQHDLGHISEQLSPSSRFSLIIFCLASGLSIAYFQVVYARHESLKVQDSPTRSTRALRVARMVLLNAISGILLMMATAIGAHDAMFRSFGAGLHSLLDPHMTQVKIDCMRIHIMNWIRYTSGWQLIENLAKHAYGLHLWALPVELLCAMCAFIILIMLDPRWLRIRVPLVLSALGHCIFPSSWAGWAVFASLFLTYWEEPETAKGPILPLFASSFRKVSHPMYATNTRKQGWHRFLVAALGLYLLSANFYSTYEINIDQAYPDHEQMQPTQNDFQLWTWPKYRAMASEAAHGTRCTRRSASVLHIQIRREVKTIDPRHDRGGDGLILLRCHYFEVMQQVRLPLAVHNPMYELGQATRSMAAWKSPWIMRGCIYPARSLKRRKLEHFSIIDSHQSRPPAFIVNHQSGHQGVIPIMPEVGDAPPGKLLKYTSYLFKNPKITDDEFHDHWRNHHSRNPLEAMKKHGVVRYTQYHCTPATRKLLTPMIQGRKDNPNCELKFEIMPFDGIVQIWFPDMETWLRVAKEPIFGKAIFEDESYLFDCTKSYTTLGWEEDMLLNGEIVMPKYQGLETCECKCGLCSHKCTASTA